MIGAAPEPRAAPGRACPLHHAPPAPPAAVACSCSPRAGAPASRPAPRLSFHAPCAPPPPPAPPLRCGLQLVSTLALIGAGAPFALPALVVLMLAFYRLYEVFQASMMQVKRLDATSRCNLVA